MTMIDWMQTIAIVGLTLYLIIYKKKEK